VLDQSEVQVAAVEVEGVAAEVVEVVEAELRPRSR
jgi:hypothetical protein